MTFEVTARQHDFINATAFEVLFGGAVGGGKSYGQILDAVGFAYGYPGSRQLVLRKTMPELERTLLPALRGLVPGNWYSYRLARRTAEFLNGSVIEFGYCGREDHAYRYQSAEYDVVRFDELTHFSEHMYTYLISRIRGANGYPKQVKSATNPGGRGHVWVKKRFVDIGAPDRAHACAGGDRIFLPAVVEDNIFLMKRDAGYAARVRNNLTLEGEWRALAEGDWSIADGRYFDEFRPRVHVVRPFDIPAHWRRFFAMDYGLDMLAGYWIAMDDTGSAVVYREVYESNHIVSSAAARILTLTREPVEEFYAPPDLWNRRQDSGRSAAEIFLESGLALTKAPADRVSGWLELKEWLRPRTDETGAMAARLRFFDSCTEILRCLPEIARDKNNPGDCARDPHELTHGPDALRYFVASRPDARQGAAAHPEASQLEHLLRYGR